MYRVSGAHTEQTYFVSLFHIKMYNEHILECVEHFQTAYMRLFNFSIYTVIRIRLINVI